MQTNGFLQASLHTTWLPPTDAFAGSNLEIFQVTIYIWQIHLSKTTYSPLHFFNQFMHFMEIELSNLALKATYSKFNL